jgi:hypothetical protein
MCFPFFGFTLLPKIFPDSDCEFYSTTSIMLKTSLIFSSTILTLLKFRAEIPDAFFILGLFLQGSNIDHFSSSGIGSDVVMRRLAGCAFDLNSRCGHIQKHMASCLTSVHVPWKAMRWQVNREPFFI